VTETFDRLIQARFDAVASPVDGRDWNDVLLRLGNARPVWVPSGRRSIRSPRAPRRVLLLFAVAALAAAVTAVAFGWPKTFVNFFASPPAPPKVRNFFGSFSVGAPRGMDPHAIPGQARRIMTARFDANTISGNRPRLHTLYVAPRKGGGFCELWTNADGGCAPGRSPRTTAESRAAGPLGVSWFSGNDGLPLVADGWVRTGATQTVEARFADGTKARVPITWVSAPISAGFFVYSVPAGHRNRKDALRSLVALDGRGNVIGRQSFPLTKPADQDVPQTLPDGTKVGILPRSAEATNARKIIGFRSTHGHPIYLWVMPHKGGGKCFFFNRGEGCDVPRFESQMPTFQGGMSGGADPILFFGQAKPQVALVELRYQDGTSERLTPVDGFVLREITPAHYRRGTRLVQAVAFDRNGKRLVTERYRPNEPAVYPCKKPINRRYGVSMCP
jgi:hypothetical protein